MNKLKILYIDEPLFPPGGGQKSLDIIINNIDKNKFQCLLFTVSGQNSNSFIDIFRKLRGILRKSKIDLIHCNAGTSKVSFIAAVLAKVYRVPFIWHIRVCGKSGFRQRIISRLTSKIIVISQEVRSKFKKNNLKKTIRLYNAVDTEIFKLEVQNKYLFEELSINRTDIIIGHFARLVPWKGHKLFLEIIKNIEMEKPDCCYLIVGAGPDKYKKELLKYSEDLAIKSRVIYLDYREDVAALMALCHVVVHTSIEPEAFGRVIIESMASGTPVVSTNLGGPSEIIKNNKTGFLEAPDSMLMSRKVLEILNNEKLKESFIIESLKEINNKFTIPQHIKALETIYGDVQKEFKK